VAAEAAVWKSVAAAAEELIPAPSPGASPFPGAFVGKAQSGAPPPSPEAVVDELAQAAALEAEAQPESSPSQPEAVVDELAQAAALEVEAREEARAAALAAEAPTPAAAATAEAEDVDAETADAAALLSVGVAVRVCNLDGVLQDLNGFEGIVTAFDEQIFRWKVDLKQEIGDMRAELFFEARNLAVVVDEQEVEPPRPVESAAAALAQGIAASSAVAGGPVQRRAQSFYGGTPLPQVAVLTDVDAESAAEVSEVGEELEALQNIVQSLAGQIATLGAEFVAASSEHSESSGASPLPLAIGNASVAWAARRYLGDVAVDDACLDQQAEPELFSERRAFEEWLDAAVGMAAALLDQRDQFNRLKVGVGEEDSAGESAGRPEGESDQLLL